MHLVIRQDIFLCTSDPTLYETLHAWASHTGINTYKKKKVMKVEGERGKPLTIHPDKGETIEADTLIWAVGLHANTEGLGLKELVVELNKKGDIVTNEYQELNVPDVLAIGEVQGRALSTPVAIAAGRRLSNRLFDRGLDTDRADTLIMVPRDTSSSKPANGLAEKI